MAFVNVAEAMAMHSPEELLIRENCMKLKMSLRENQNRIRKVLLFLRKCVETVSR